MARTRRAVLFLLVFLLGLVLGVLYQKRNLSRPPQDRPSSVSHAVRCRLHGTLLREDKIRITYGVPPPEREQGYDEAQERFFPNACTLYYGGDVHDNNPPAYHEVWYCPVCRQAERRWLQDHPDQWPYGR